MVKGIIAYPEKCTGCRLCEIACSTYHHGEANPLLSYIQTYKKGVRIDLPLVCTQGVDCGEDFCVDVCPVDAISRNEDGVVVIDQNTCIGCGICVSHCPMKAIRLINRKAFKCDLCGGDPQCVKVCTSMAIKFVEIGQNEVEKIHQVKKLMKEVF